MCISPIKVPYNGKRLYVDNNPKLINYVPCGKCFQCRMQKTKELMVRAYFNECKYVIFDTLTYEDSKLHYYDDIAVLYYPDVQKFLKRFRKKLSKSGIKLDSDIKYIVAGEYGTKNTLRPHWHLLLFVNNDYNPVELSKIINQTWQNGITDGVINKGIDYFKNKRLFSDFEAKQKVVGYICKYMVKTTGIINKVEDNLFYDVWLKLDDENLKMTNYELTKYIDKIIKPYCQQIHWSKGFGAEFLKNKIEQENLIKKGYIQINTDLKFNKYNVPLYYRRKLSQYKIHETNVITKSACFNSTPYLVITFVS